FIKNNLYPQSITYIRCDIEQPHFVSCPSMLLDFLPKTYNIQKWIFYLQLILHSTYEVLYPNFLVSLRRSSTYFLWEIKIHCLEYAVSIPKNYLSFPNSYISNCVASFSFRVSMKEDIFNIKLFNQSCFVSVKGPIRFTLQSYNPLYSLATPIILLIYSPRLLFVNGFHSEVDPFVEPVDPIVKPFPVTMTNPMLELPLSSMIDCWASSLRIIKNTSDKEGTLPRI
ncbi:hypothetical protein CR513_16851, partial [Mucuna pruriens]